MSRLGSIGTQYFDNAGDPLVDGKLYFYESGTTTEKITYADVSLTTPNSNPVILSAAGRQPNIFFDGNARVILTDKDDVQIEVRDPVGTTVSTYGQYWVDIIVYGKADVVRGSNDLYYESLIHANLNNNPVDNTGEWIEQATAGGVAGKINRVGDLMTGQLSGLTPVDPENFTRKDYVDSLIEGKSTGVKNILINGSFNFWQRGATFDQAVEAFTYTADQWWVSASEADSRKVNKQFSSIEDAKLIGQDIYLKFNPINQTLPVDNRLFQNIENTYPGRALALSAWVEFDEDSTISFEFRSVSNLGGSNDAISPDIAVTAGTWQKVTWTFTCPDLPVGASPYLSQSTCVVKFPDTITGSFRIAGIQLELGSVATDFEHLNPQKELASCQRYYWVGELADSFGNKFNNSLAQSNGLAGSATFPSQMYSVPTLAIETPPTLTNCESPTVFTESNDSMVLRVTTLATANSYRAFGGVYSATASIA